jgi:hypothetical protein
VMMGWEKAIVGLGGKKGGKGGGWVNIDGDFEWRGVAW